MESSPARPSPDRNWPQVLILLVLPIAVLWRQDNMLFPSPDLIDAWVYLGLFCNLVNFKRSIFPNLYYGSRLSWILPGYFVHHLFSPVIAHYVLHWLVHSIATVSLFWILRLTGNRRSAFLTAIFFCMYPLVWYATGSDYVDGAGVAYCLLAMALLTRAAVQSQWTWSLLLGGLAIACMVYTNLFLVVLIPLLFLFFVALRWIWNRTPLIQSAVYGALWLGGGFAIVTVVLGAINVVIDGNFWFYAPSLRFLGRMMGIKNPWFVSIWAPEGLWPWLWLPALAAAIAIVLFPFQLRDRSKEGESRVLFSVLFLAVLALMGFIQSRGTPALALRYYACYLLPFLFPFLGVSFWGAIDKLGSRTYALICCGAIVMSGVLWSDYSRHFAPIWPTSVRELAWITTGIFSLVLIVRDKLAGTLFALAGCVLLIWEAQYLPPPNSVPLSAMTPSGPHAFRSDYERIMRARERIESVRDGNPIRFLYDDKEPAFLDYRALNSTYHSEYTQLGASPDHACDAHMEPGDLLVVLSDRATLAQQAASTLDNCWHKFGMTVDRLPSVTFSRGGHAYSMTLLKAAPNTSTRHSIEGTFDSAGNGFLQRAAVPGFLPLERWKAWVNKEERSTIEHVRDGFAVRTPDGQHAWGAMYAPLIAQTPGRYRFSLKYKPESGHFAFGIYAGDLSKWLGVATEGRQVSGNESEMSVWVDLRQGELILPRIENDDLTGNHPASFVMRQFTAIVVDP